MRKGAQFRRGFSPEHSAESVSGVGGGVFIGGGEDLKIRTTAPDLKKFQAS